jgi:hypothetical protein
MHIFYISYDVQYFKIYLRILFIYLSICGLFKTRLLMESLASNILKRIYSKPLLIRLQLIRMSDNLDQNMKNVAHS